MPLYVNVDQLMQALVTWCKIKCENWMGAKAKGKCT